ncbi:MAG TPA: pyrimidine-nucleoside phosphorylase [Peptococcaceae bacterium]|nr:pyrimidine-nucleoside phosphorylase [Peptococcaceae bacterium]
MRMVDLIAKKRDGLPLTKDELRYIVQGYVRGDIPDYQMAALAMAIYYQGMSAEETAQLTLAMVESGEQVDLSDIGQFTVDKHSSGGVGDKTTLIVGPLVAACGLPVAKMSGRGLGHTGGTIDKLSAIPGFRVELSQEDFLRQVKQVGIAVIAQSANLVPADKKLYALRDVTATVDSIPLIASSIMSKKIASGAKGIVLDVKYGSGAFMTSVAKAEELAKTMVAIGQNLNRKTVAVLSNMDQPLGNAVGNSLEVLEAIDTLQGNGPPDLQEVCLELAGWMLLLGQKANSLQEAKNLLTSTLTNGQAWEKFLEFVAAQGGEKQVLIEKDLTLAPIRVEFKASRAGYVHRINARQVGISAMLLGAGRETKESPIDYGAGIYLHVKCGDYVQANQPLATLYTSKEEQIEPSLQLLAEAFVIENHPISSPPLISRVVSTV